jgi:GNAT superfamily N-acetyltransferase
LSVIGDIEEALFTQWSHVGRWPGATLHEDHGLMWFETPITHLPYNGVIRTRVDPGVDVERLVAAVTGTFGARDVQSFWMLHPTSRADLPELLARHDVRPVERMTGMSIELADRRPPAPSDVEFREVVGDHDMDAYIELTMELFGIPADERAAVAAFHTHWGPGRIAGHRYIGWLGDAPIAKAYLSVAGPPGVASIYGMGVRPEARGRGVAAGLTAILLDRATDLGMTRAVLHATDMARDVYRRAGFVERCELQVYATGALYPDGH